MTTERRTLILDADVSSHLAAMRQSEKAVDGVTRSADKLGKELDQAEKEASGLTKVLGAVNDKLGGLAAHAGPIGNLPPQFLAVGAAAGAAALAVRFVGDETARLDKIAKDSQKSGLGLEAYQRLSHVATLSGTDVNVLGKSINMLNVQLAETARTGAGPAAVALQELGLSVSDLQGKDATDQLKVLSAAMSELPTEADKSRIAMRLMSEGGTQLIPLLNAGADGIDAMVDSTGKLFTREDVAKAEAYQDALANQQKALNDIKGTIAIQLAPVMTDLTARMTEATKEGGERLGPVLVLAVDRIAAAITPVVKVVGFFAGQLAALADAAETVGDAVGDAAGKVSELASEWWEDSWLKSTTDSLRTMANDGVEKVSKALEEQFPWVKGLREEWDELSASMTKGTIVDLAKEMAGPVAEAQRQIRAEAEAAAVAEGDRKQQLERSVAAAEHAVALAEAQKRPAAELERLYRNQHAARLELLLATNDLAALEKEMAGEEIRQAKARASRRGGGSRGPTEAERMQQAGEILLRQYEQRIELAEAEASLIFEAAVELPEQRHKLELANLRLEQQTLDVTKAKGDLQREAIEARKAEIDREIEILELQERRRQQTEAVELQQQAAEQRIAALDREIERNEALGVSVRLLQEQRDLAAISYVETYGTEEELREERHTQELARIAELQAAEETAAKRREKLHAEELKRQDARVKKQQATISAVNSFVGAGEQFFAAAVASHIKNEEKREKATMRFNGVMALVKAAIETVEAVAAFARYDFVGGALHIAAAAVATATGVGLLAGQVPHGGSAAASSGGGGGGGTTADPGQYKGPGAAQEQRERPSTPANAEALARLRGDTVSETSAPRGGGGGTQINAQVIVSNDSAYQLDKLASDDRRKWG